MTTPRHAMVLGATGFVGRRVCDHLATLGWKVDRVVRSASMRDATAASASTVDQTIEITSIDDIGSALSASRPPIVLNLAAAGIATRASQEDLVNGNAGIVAKLLSEIDPAVTELVVHAGSWSQYSIGDRPDPIRETCRMEPESAYGCAKVGAELMGRAIGFERGIRFVTLRLFNVYGPGESPTRLIPHIARSVAEDSIAELTSGEQTRDFVHVDDVAAAFEACAEASRLELPAYNVATGVATSVREVSLLASESAGGTPENLHFGARPPRVDEPDQVVGDASALREATGWRPAISVSHGVPDTVRQILNEGMSHA